MATMMLASSSRPSLAVRASAAQPRLASPANLTSARRVSRRRVVKAKAEEDKKQGGRALQDLDDPQTPSLAASAKVEGSELDKVMKELPPEQQKAISQVYMWMVQHPEANLQFSDWNGLQRILDEYQVLVWRPAELLNGRMAMLGFVAALGCEAVTGQSIWTQLYRAPVAYLSAYLVIVGAAWISKQYGYPQKGIGPFTRSAELWNGRFAMLGFSILAYIEYNQDLQRAMLFYLSRLQSAPIPGVHT